MATTARKPRRTKTLESIIGSACRPRVPGAFYKMAPGVASLAIDLIDGPPPYVDLNAMSATFKISTGCIDRMGDVLVPNGCSLKNYALNPVVLWAHGMDGITTPLGTSEDPDGNLSVIITDTDVKATCFFSQSNFEAGQIFDLIVEKVVRACSVRETPISSRYARDPEYGEYLLVDEWDLEEWSPCCVGVNQEAVAKAQEVLRHGKLNGASIGPSIMKSLLAICPEGKILGKGCDMTVKAKADDKPDDKKPEPEKTPAADVGNEADTQSTAEESSDGEDSSKLYGHQLTTASHGSVSDCIKAMQAGVVPCENETVRKGMTDVIDSMKDVQASIVGVHKQAYPDSKALDTPEESEDMTDADMKAWLAQGKGRDLQVFGVAGRLKSMAAAKNLTPEQRRILTECDAHLSRMAVQCKTAKPEPKLALAVDPDAAKVAGLQKQIDDLKKLAQV